MTEEPAVPDGADYWTFLIDPGWQEQEPGEQAPYEAVVGGWPVAADGTTGRFSANPDYVPSSAGSPTDPIDATVRLVTKGEVESGAVLATLREAEFAVAVDDEQNPVVAPSPDEVPSVLVTTASQHRQWVNAAGWQVVTAAELAEVLPDEGVDVLINPDQRPRCGSWRAPSNARWNSARHLPLVSEFPFASARHQPRRRASARWGFSRERCARQTTGGNLAHTGNAGSGLG